MSLFPAYSDISVTGSTAREEFDVKDEKRDWLQNSSFPAAVISRNTLIDISDSSEDDSVVILSSPERPTEPRSTILINSDSSSEELYQKSKRIKKHKKDKKRHKSVKSKHQVTYDREVKNVYYEDKFRDKGNSKVDTLCSRARPIYTHMKNAGLGFVPFKQHKSSTFQRYCVTNIDSIEKSLKKDTTIKRHSEKDSISQNDAEILSWCANIEEEQKSSIREFNEKLTDDPNNIQLWLQYVYFQDVIARFQKNQLAKDIRITTFQKKESIINKALEKNPNSHELLKIKLNLMSELLPADQLSNEMETLVNKDTGNITLWQAFIMTTQGSVAMCTVPKVLSLYSKCLCTLRQRSRTNPHIYDKRILEMLYRCLIFLRHAGLWEQMWETLRLNLCLNLSLNKDSLKLQSSIDEKKLIGMEEVVLTSRLPLNQLWLRVESLRERCHWLSVSSDELELVGDSRRFVLPEDVADFVHPMVSMQSNFRLAIYSLMSLKVPLLPTRDSILQDLAIKDFDWSGESLEMLLPLSYPSIGVMAGHRQRKALLDGILEGRLTSGPQYLRFHPAQEPYLDFIRDAFKVIAENLQPSQRTSIYVWWLRFERLLVFFSKNDPLKNDSRRKKLKNILKEFLKKDENRNNLHFYREYALIEREMERFDNCVNILETTIQSQGQNLESISNDEEKTALLSVYRTLFETLLDVDTYKESHSDRILKICSHIVSGSNESRLTLVEKYLQNSVRQFLENPVATEVDDTYFLPSFECDIITCYVYFLYVTKRSINEIIQVFDECLKHCQDRRFLRECLYESKIMFLQLYIEQKHSVQHILKETVYEALKLYPDNFYMLSVFSGIEIELPCWKIIIRSENIRPWPAISMCLTARARIIYLQKHGLFDAARAALNKLLSFHRKLARVAETRCCPLIWRLYMLLLREQDLCEKRGEEVYHESVAQCPWARCIYIDAAEVAPQLLTQIQDIIREKELRMHVTPEELDILRG